MKNIIEIINDCPTGFIASSVADAYRKGVKVGVRAAAAEYKDVIESVLNELDLTEEACSLELEPHEYVKQILLTKDREIALLKLGLRPIL